MNRTFTPILYVDGSPDGGRVLIARHTGRAAGEGAPIETDHKKYVNRN